MENFKNKPTKREELISDSWSILVTIVPTATAISLADTFINRHTDKLDKAEIEAQIESLTMDLTPETLPVELRDEALKTLSNTRSYLSNE